MRQSHPVKRLAKTAAALLALAAAGCKSAPKATPVAATPAHIQRVARPGVAVDLEPIIAAVMSESPKGLGNPFAQRWQLSGLPQGPNGCGSGGTMSMDGAAAQDLVRRLFVAEGLEPQPTVFNEEGFTASADGYDPEQRIGFVIADAYSLDHQALRDEAHEVLAAAIAQAKGFRLAKEEEQESWLLDRRAAVFFHAYPLDETQRKELAAIPTMESIPAKGRAYLALAAKLDEPLLSMAEIERADQMAADRQRYLAVISVVDQRFESSYQEYDGFAGRYAEIEIEATQRTFADAKEKAAWTNRQREVINLEVKRDHLTKLARSVREYIAWARRNGLQ